MQLYELEEVYATECVLNDSKQVYHEMRDIKSWTKEAFVVFFLDARNKVISREIVNIGTLDQAIVHPREVFRTAIMRNAASLVIAHNHPSGSTSPSEEDTQITHKMREAGKIIGIDVLDHVIVARDGDYSLLENDWM